MIYEAVPINSPIQQGDIFGSVPLVRVRLEGMLIASSDGCSDEVANWAAVKNEADVKAIFEVKGVPAIVITPDCDALRTEVITLAEVKPFGEVEGKWKKEVQNNGSKKDLDRKVKIITQHCRLNQKWFYLPRHGLPRFGEPMGADFRSVISILRQDLLQYRILRAARLRSPAIEHLRERLGEFYSRYPYDEWYPLTTEEFKNYQSGDLESKPFPWQIWPDA